MSIQKPSRAPAVQWQQVDLAALWTTLKYTTIQSTQQPEHISSQYINVFYSSSNALGRLGEPALLTHHLQGAAVHCWLRPAVRSSGPYWLVWHEYVA
jgi:hypothetical protein